MPDQFGEMAPENRFAIPSQYLAAGPSPFWLSAFFTRWLQIQFCDPTNLLDPYLRTAPSGARFIWNEDIRQTGMLITQVVAWEKEAQEARPALLVKANDWDFQGMGIGDKHHGGMGSDVHERFSRFVLGSHTIFCLSREPEECAHLAWEVALHLMHFQQVLMKDLQLLRFGLAKIAAPGKLKEATDTFACPITVVYGSEMSWTLRMEAPVLKAVTLSKEAT